MDAVIHMFLMPEHQRLLDHGKSTKSTDSNCSTFGRLLFVQITFVSFDKRGFGKSDQSPETGSWRPLVPVLRVLDFSDLWLHGKIPRLVDVWEDLSCSFVEQS